MKKELNTKLLKWINEPKYYVIDTSKVIIGTEPYTNLWHNTNGNQIFNNAHCLVFDIHRDFTFTVKVEYRFNKRLDQCGILLMKDEYNYLKVDIEHKNEEISFLTSTLTLNAYSDMASGNLANGIETMYFRLSRRDNDFLVENSYDGKKFKRMRICHLDGTNFKLGIYACSPLDSSFDAIFQNLYLEECIWKKGDL
ncbi:MAG: DUF1349 domain-containing protein [Erysipelotrichaceae bacterium]|nr:DUF1349 domain-containing protein [Erysipelotrichaceae bacterium]